MKGTKQLSSFVLCSLESNIKLSIAIYFSGAMLRINAEPSFFTEIFTELKSVGAHSEFRT